jgi:hypothetical protein
MKRGPKLIAKVYGKPIRTGRYLHFRYNHPHHAKRGIVHTLFNRGHVICQNRKDSTTKLKTLRHDLIINAYPKEFFESNEANNKKPSFFHYPFSQGILREIHSRRQPFQSQNYFLN